MVRQNGEGRGHRALLRHPPLRRRYAVGVHRGNTALDAAQRHLAQLHPVCRVHDQLPLCGTLDNDRGGAEQPRGRAGDGSRSQQHEDALRQGYHGQPPGDRARCEQREVHDAINTRHGSLDRGLRRVRCGVHGRHADLHSRDPLQLFVRVHNPRRHGAVRDRHGGGDGSLRARHGRPHHHQGARGRGGGGGGVSFLEAEDELQLVRHIDKQNVIHGLLPRIDLRY
mmetsp:Transcript_32180/g.76405  ORF Transcript_32180/g.76405 Transcript_32180/m.76405 type:complete len:225 (-) Transcript_32180:28-702(-)